MLKELKKLGYDEKEIFFIFDRYPIGVKYREKGLGRKAWLKGDIERAKQYIAERNTETLRGPEIKPVNTNQCVPENQYLSEVQELNERHAVVMLGGKCLVINETVDPIIIKYQNRLSDYLFVLSRKVSQDLKGEEIPWKPAF